MVITVNEFIKQTYNKYDEIKQKFVDTIDWEKYSNCDRYAVKYGKDISMAISGRRMFSASILRHVDANKCLFSKLTKKAPSLLKTKEYTLYYYDDYEKLIMSEFIIDAYSKQVTYYLNDNNGKQVQVTYFIMPNENSQLQKYFSSIEFSVYDNNRLIKCETYLNQAKAPYGISLYGEYYEYDESKLVKATKYDDYNRNFKMNTAIKELCPTLVVNPHVYEYDFEYNQNSVFCQKSRQYSEKEKNVSRYELKKAELINLANNGVNCFGI